MKCLTPFLLLSMGILLLHAEENGSVVTFPAPGGMAASKDYTVTANGAPVFVYPVRVREKTVTKPGIRLLTNELNGETQWASLGLFDFSGSVTVKVTILRPFKTVEIVPASLGITPQVNGSEVSFVLSEPKPVTLLLDNATDAPLHLLTHRPEQNRPSPTDPNVIYFGPGIHETGPIIPKSGQTVYLAGGAYLRSVIEPGETGKPNRFGLVSYGKAAIYLDGVENVHIAGRGIIDCGAIPHIGRPTLVINESSNIKVEGITLLNAANWNMPILRSHDVTVSGLGIIAGRLNSDGIDTVGSQNVTVSDCFVRNHDDSLVVKTMASDQTVANILYKDCTVWSDWGYSIGTSYESRGPIHDVTFRNIDIIASRSWPIGVLVNDSATVENIRFEDIRIRDLSRNRERDSHAPWITLSISKDAMWSTDAEAGHIRNVTLDRITMDDTKFPATLVSLHGFDAEHQIEGVTFHDITINGKPALTEQALQLNKNAFVQDLKIGSTP